MSPIRPLHPNINARQATYGIIDKQKATFSHHGGTQKRRGGIHHDLGGCPLKKVAAPCSPARRSTLLCLLLWYVYGLLCQLQELIIRFDQQMNIIQHFIKAFQITKAVTKVLNK